MLSKLPVERPERTQIFSLWVEIGASPGGQFSLLDALLNYISVDSSFFFLHLNFIL